MAAIEYENLKILIIDDFESFRLSVCNMLDEFGCEHLETEINGRRAIRLLEEKEFDVILCDYNLGPGPTGQQVLETLRERGLLQQRTLFILVSAETSKAIVLSAYDYQPDAYLSKPITGQGLKKRLDRLLRQRQELLPIYEAMDDGNSHRAIELAQQRIFSGSRYTSTCHKLLGELYLQVGMLDEAEGIYSAVVDARPLDWAKVGLAKVKMERGELSEAKTLLDEVLQDNPFFMQAYDELAHLYGLRKKDEEVQEVLEQAVTISPMAIARQSELADAAFNNRDYLVASKAYGKSVKLGENSCHDRLHNHLQFARATSEFLRDEPNVNSDLARESLGVLEQVDKRFDLDRRDRLSGKLLEVQLQIARGEKRRANEIYQSVEKDLANQTLSLETELDLVATLTSLGDEQGKTQMLKELLIEYKDDEQALRQIDVWLEEPASEYNTKLVAKINNQGIGLYKQKNYADAIQSFTKVARLFPNHLGVKLNLAQVLLEDMKENGVSDVKMDQCLTALKGVEKRIKPSHEQFQRYRQLHQSMRVLG